VNKKIISLLVVAIVVVAALGIVFFQQEISKPNTVTIKGRIPSGHTKVAAFYPDGHYNLIQFSGGEFSIDVEKGAPLVLIFLSDNNDYLGYVTLENGIDTFPMTRVAEGVATIDLGNISLSGTTFTPDHNPIADNEIQLTPEEQAVVAQIDDFFASLAKNPDTDSNGKVDFLEHKFFHIGILYFINGGSFGSNLTPDVSTQARIEGYRLMFGAQDTDRPDTVVFNGPEGSGLSNATSEQRNVYTGMTDYFSPYVDNPQLPPGGRYTVAYKTTDLSFDIPDQSSASSRIVLAVPTVTLNDDGTINKISWRYISGDGGEVDPKGITTEFQIQIDGTGTPYQNYPQPGRMYNSEWLPSEITEHVLPTQNIKWADVTCIYMAYNDIYGNHYVVTFFRYSGMSFSPPHDVSFS